MRGGKESVIKTRRLLGLLSLSVIVAIFVYNALFSFSYSVGPNYRNVSIDTRVNITNAGPEILSIRMSNPVVLSAGNTTVVQCNVSVRDFNGYADINMTNATIYHSTSTHISADNNNTHYTNLSCGATDMAGNMKNFTCNFTVYYYALNGTWWCNASVNDSSRYNATFANATNFSALLALNVSPLIDYGNMAVGDTSANNTANITNIGNVPINISVKGYGLAQGDGLAFVCDSGNISIANEKFSANASHDYSQKTALSTSFQSVANMSIQKQSDATLQTNTTYWQVYIPPNPYGQCNGTIVFQAELS